ncbi:hypothetical protein K504DRAFT_393235 [Pleomassaria siparia CBS 279.74]|uniref:Rhodopsin domain-containing protein n=1 Tax=Pleomassaria siparia CBS 279.74 TaxID=1314801 RepID=A0A6G1JS15_9PLEO|nr:hypothetical protein K504DRAFT_393235 [Pleomassaria siparia CBS 279.74]
MVQYGLFSAAVVYGLGRHARFVSFSSRRTSLELLFISQVFWYCSITLVKLSVALLLLRLKRTRSWRVFLYFVITLILLAAIVQTFFQFLQCRPFRVYWDPRVFRQGPVTCFDERVINGNIVAFSSVQIGLDLVFSFIPITFIRKLNRPRREKVFMCVLMALGVFASVAAIARTLTLQNLFTSEDLFRTNVTIALWAVVEQQFALIAANIPTLKSFMEHTLVKVGLYFYDEGTETQVRDQLVHFGFLEENEKLDKPEKEDDRSRKMSYTVGSPRSDRKMTGFDDLGSMLETINDKDVENMLNQTERSPV